jgi:hypothetical protein
MAEIGTELLGGASLASPNATRKRYTRQVHGSPTELPGEHIDLLRRWIKPRQVRRKWSALLADAGGKHLEAALKLADWLLRHGWSVQYEKRSGSRWETTWLEFPRLDALREIFQLPDPRQLASDWASANAYRFDAADLAAAHSALASLPLARRLQRFSLLKSLELWRVEERQGTRRDFSLLARGDSKGVTAAEWNWLAAAVDLERSGIFEHTPHLLVAGPIRLHTGSGIIDLNASADWAALTPETLATARYIEGQPRVWRLVENLTSFERSARQRSPDMAVVWLPGFPPGWWQESMRHLLVGAPAPAEIACDPDPAGIAIALQAAKLWEAASLPWMPFAMRRDDLLAASQRKPLTEHDRQQLTQLLSGTLPPVLRQLATTLHELGEKAEQEAYL